MAERTRRKPGKAPWKASQSPLRRCKAHMAESEACAGCGVQVCQACGRFDGSGRSWCELCADARDRGERSI